MLASDLNFTGYEMYTSFDYEKLDNPNWGRSFSTGIGKLIVADNIERDLCIIQKMIGSGTLPIFAPAKSAYDRHGWRKCK